MGGGRLLPQILHISIEATNQAWMEALVSMSGLKELVIGVAQPSSLGARVVQSLIVQPVHANNLGAAFTPGEVNVPLCPSLRRFGLKYHRWLRSSEHFDLIPDFVSIIWSRQRSNCPLQSFQVWTRGDQKDPLELIEDSRISLEGFGCLANSGGRKGDDLFDLLVMRLVQNVSKPSAEPFTASHKNGRYIRSRGGLI